MWADLRTAQREALGQQPAFALVDASIGAAKDGLGIELFVNNVFDRVAENYRYAECAATACAPLAVYRNLYKPRMIGVKFSQKF